MYINGKYRIPPFEGCTEINGYIIEKDIAAIAPNSKTLKAFCFGK